MILNNSLISRRFISILNIILLTNSHQLRMKEIIQSTIQSGDNMMFSLEVNTSKNETSEISTPGDALLNLHFHPRIEVGNLFVPFAQSVVVVRNLEKVSHHTPGSAIHNKNTKDSIPSSVVIRDSPGKENVHQKVRKSSSVNKETIEGERKSSSAEEERSVIRLVLVERFQLLFGVKTKEGEWLPDVMVELVVVGVQVMRTLMVVDPALGVDGPGGLEPIEERRSQLVNKFVSKQFSTFVMAHMEDVEGVSHPQKSRANRKERSRTPKKGEEDRRQNEGHESTPQLKNGAMNRFLFLNTKNGLMNLLEEFTTRRSMNILLLSNGRNFPINIATNMVTQKEQVRSWGLTTKL